MPSKLTKSLDMHRLSWFGPFIVQSSLAKMFNQLESLQGWSRESRVEDKYVYKT